MRTLTGLQPSGKLHIGNYFGSIKQMIDAQQDQDMFIFIANYHAMTSVSEAKTLRQNTIEAAMVFLSLGVDPIRSTFWVQSDVKDVLELYWILSQFTPMGLLERAHSYKDKVAKGISANHGLFSYPVLMAADILLFGADVVPVGKDQIQHVEIARDIAVKFNNQYGDILKLPEFKVDESVSVVPGTDGAKMSKSYKNTIEIFTDEKSLKKQIGKIITSSEPLEAPKEWRNCNIYNIAKLFLDKTAQKNLQDRYEKGGEGHGHFKAYLNNIIWEYFGEARDKFEYYKNNTNEVEQLLLDGAKKAKKASEPIMQKIREVTGL